MIPLPQLLERRWEELPFGPFDAQQRGRLVGDREPREGPLVVLTVLAHTALVEVNGRRHLARLQDLEVASEELSWGRAQKPQAGPRPQAQRGASAQLAVGENGRSLGRIHELERAATIRGGRRMGKDRTKSKEK